MPGPWPDMLDILLGTTNREDLEKCADEQEGGRGILQPDLQLWCDYGIPWLKKTTWKFDDAKYAMFKPDVKLDKLELLNTVKLEQKNEERQIYY